MDNTAINQATKYIEESYGDYRPDLEQCKKMKNIFPLDYYATGEFYIDSGKGGYEFYPDLMGFVGRGTLSLGEGQKLYYIPSLGEIIEKCRIHALYIFKFESPTHIYFTIRNPTCEAQTEHIYGDNLTDLFVNLLLTLEVIRGQHGIK